MNIKLYRSFHKRENSTAVPDDESSSTVYVNFTGNLKEPSSVINPVVKFKPADFNLSGTDLSPTIFTYAYIPFFSRYYYIKDWIWNNGLWEADLKEDVLASFAGEIGTITAYIERTSSVGYIDGSIIDTMYPATTNLDIEKTEFRPIWFKRDDSTVGDSFFILGVVGCHPTSTTGVKYYAMSPSQLSDLMQYMMSTDIYSNMGYGGQNEPLTILTSKALYNPIQYITSCFYFPIDRRDYQENNQLTPGMHNTTNVYIGPFPVGTGANEVHPYPAYSIGTGCFYHQITISLPSVHPQAADRGKYLNYAPYTRYTLHYSPFGVIPIDPSFFEVGDKIRLTTWMDGVTGKGRLIIERVDMFDPLDPVYTIISEHDALIGIPVQLSQVSIDYLRSAIATVDSSVSLTSALTGLASGNVAAVGGGISGALHSIGDSLSALSPQLLTQGTNGSRIGFYDDENRARLVARYSVMVDDDPVDLGRPSCKKAMLSVVGNSGGSGTFIKCADAPIDFKCLDDEKPMIVQHLLNGIFWE